MKQFYSFYFNDDDIKRVSLLRDMSKSSNVNHTAFLIERQLILQDLFDRCKDELDRFLSASCDVSLVIHPFEASNEELIYDCHRGEKL